MRSARFEKSTCNTSNVNFEGGIRWFMSRREFVARRDKVTFGAPASMQNHTVIGSFGRWRDECRGRTRLVVWADPAPEYRPAVYVASNMHAKCDWLIP